LTIGALLEEPSASLPLCVIGGLSMRLNSIAAGIGMVVAGIAASDRSTSPTPLSLDDPAIQYDTIPLTEPVSRLAERLKWADRASLIR
jgi:hypothetical protein